MIVDIRRGRDLRLGGAPAQAIADGPALRTVGLVGADTPGLTPRLLVEPGDRVAAGQALVADRDEPRIVVTSPAGGTVAAIHRGRRRALESVVVRVDDDAPAGALGPGYPAEVLRTLERAAVAGRLMAAGLWPSFRTRPYSRVPAAGTVPEAVFVTAIDTRPQAPDPAFVISGGQDAFLAGLEVVARLTDGPVYVCSRPPDPLPVPASDRFRPAQFSGPHPAGLPGTHIHHLCPVGNGRVVWHVGYQDVLCIGRLFLTGRPDFERVVALSGPPCGQPRLVRTRLGAATADLVGEPAGCRVVSGSVLDGRTAAGAVAFLGRHHLQLTVLAEPPGGQPARGRRGGLTTALHGVRSAMIPREDFEAVVPLDLPVAPLLRALLVGDVGGAERLGCLELDPEDLALVTLACPAKIDYGSALLAVLETLRSGR